MACNALLRCTLKTGLIKLCTSKYSTINKDVFALSNEICFICFFLAYQALSLLNTMSIATFICGQGVLMLAYRLLYIELHDWVVSLCKLPNVALMTLQQFRITVVILWPWAGTWLLKVPLMKLQKVQAKVPTTFLWSEHTCNGPHFHRFCVPSQKRAVDGTNHTEGVTCE